MADDRDMIDSLQRELNTLGKLFAEMNSEVKHLFQHAQEERLTSSEYRKDMRQEVQALRMEQAHSNLQMVGLKSGVDEVKADVGKLSTKVGKFEEKVDTIEGTHQQQVGAGKIVIVLAKLLYAVGGAAVAFVVWLIASLMQGRFPMPKQ